MEYTTAEGHRLRIGRIPRARIDAFGATNPPPEPPTKTVEVWGGLPEKVPDTNDPEYQEAVSKYYIDTRLDQLDLIADAVDIVSDSGALDEIESLGLARDEASSLAFLVRDPAELQDIVEGVFYNSTVTPRGIIEAAQRFGVRWEGKPVNPLAIPKGSAMSNGVYGDQMAARWRGYTWDDFCNLSGPRQSEIVALRRLDTMLGIRTAHAQSQAPKRIRS